MKKLMKKLYGIIFRQMAKQRYILQFGSLKSPLSFSSLQQNEAIDQNETQTKSKSTGKQTGKQTGKPAFKTLFVKFSPEVWTSSRCYQRVSTRYLKTRRLQSSQIRSECNFFNSSLIIQCLCYTKLFAWECKYLRAIKGLLF